MCMVLQVLVTCLASPSLDVTLAAMRATSAFIQVCYHGWGAMRLVFSSHEVLIT